MGTIKTEATMNLEREYHVLAVRSRSEPNDVPRVINVTFYKRSHREWLQAPMITWELAQGQLTRLWRYIAVISIQAGNPAE